MSLIRQHLQSRKKELLEQLKKLRPLQDELAEVEAALDALDDRSKRHGNEAPGHPAGCRCYPHCDPSR